VIVADEDALRDRPAVERALREALRPGLDLEVWDERHLLRLLGERLGVALAVLGEDDLLGLVELLRTDPLGHAGLLLRASASREDPLREE
jgi:hypothetical protein